LNVVYQRHSLNHVSLAYTSVSVSSRKYFVTLYHWSDSGARASLSSLIYRFCTWRSVSIWTLFSKVSCSS